MTSLNDLTVNYSVGTGLSFGRVKPRSHSWPVFKKQFKTPLRTTEKLAFYNKMPHDEQVANKAQNGWFYRTQTQGKRRNAKSGMPTNIITLDFDKSTVELFEEIRQGLILLGIAFFIHTSRRHTPEKPRFRMVIPLDKPLPNDAYPAVSRILAQKIDPEMTQVDPVSFRVAQMMFMPVVSIDQEFVYDEQSGEALDWEALLVDFELHVGDWRNLALLPKCEGEKLRQTAEKAEDPWEKTGQVGTFCRAYTIPEAIEKFLPDVYEESNGGENRYTYLGGTTTDGMEVYDDGRFMYSHHGSDPASDQLLNAFDMVRIHLFGSQDEDKDEDLPILKRPSARAMLEFIADDEGYRNQHFTDNYDRESMFDDIADPELDEEAYAPEHQVAGDVYDPEIDDLIGTPKMTLPSSRVAAPVDPDWFKKLEVNPRTGEIEPSLPNIVQILMNEKRFRACLEYNEFVQKIVSRRQLNSKITSILSTPISDKVSGDPISDRLIGKIRAILETPNGKKKAGYGLRVTDRDMNMAVNIVSEHWSFHPVRDALSSFKWDGVARLATFLIDFLGCPDLPYYREIAVKWFVAGVARTFEPGHKFDFAIILEGVQGKRKSTMIRIIGLNWAGELKADFHDEKRLVEQMMGNFVMELPELSSFSRSSVEDMKAFMAAVINFVRLSYAHHPETFKRQCIFMGSTNKDQYLLDDTGNRRFWPCPVVVDQIDTDTMRRVITQVWAEAVDVYRQMRAAQPEGDLPLHLTNPESIAYAAAMQEARRQTTEADTYAPEIGEWLDTPYAPDKMDPDMTLTRDSATMNEIWQLGMGMQGFPDRSKQIEIGKAMKKIGWERTRVRVKGTDALIWVYTRPGVPRNVVLSSDLDSEAISLI